MNVYAVVLESASRDAKKKNVSAGSPSETLVTGEKLAICHWSCETGGSKDGIVIGKKCCKNYVVSTCTRNGKCKF